MIPAVHSQIGDVLVLRDDAPDAPWTLVLGDMQVHDRPSLRQGCEDMIMILERRKRTLLQIAGLPWGPDASRA